MGDDMEHNLRKVMLGWVVSVNSDLTEGRGFQTIKHVCECEATARRLAHRADVQGCDGAVIPVDLYKADDGMLYGPITIERATKEDSYEQTKIDARNAAIKKARDAGLSDEDIAALK